MFQGSVVAIVLLACIGMASPDPLHPASATSLERIVIQFSGPFCRSQDTDLSLVLSLLPGVRALDLASVPGLALVDVEPEFLSHQNLVEPSRRFWGSERECWVEPIQSCISAGPLGHSGRPPAGHAAMTH